MVVLRRLDALLEPSKDEVMKELAFQKDEAKFTEWDENGLRQASGYVFYNTSEWTLQRLHDTATNNQQILQANFEDYLNGFSSNVKEIIEKFKLKSQVRHMVSVGLFVMGLYLHFELTIFSNHSFLQKIGLLQTQYPL